MSYGLEKVESYKLLGGVNTKASAYINGPEEFRDIVNMNFATPGALTKRPGSALYIGATVVGRITGGVEFERLSGASYVVVTANTNAYTLGASSYNAFKTGLTNGAVFDFVTFVDRMFACNGAEFFKFDGTNPSNVGLPNGYSGFGVTGVVGGGLSGTFVASYGYQNDRGYYGPPSTGLTISLNGITFGTIGYYGLTAPSGFGISAIALYRSVVSGVDQYGTTIGNAATTTLNDIGFTLTTRAANTAFYFTLAPRYMEIYNNQLFMAGFSTLPSTAYWTDIGEPESVQPNFSAEFRTNDGDRITGLKSYNGSLVVSKSRSFHRVTGDNPSNFSLQELSDQYGCISNRSMVVWENKLWFLDTKGIVEFDGASIQVVSNKVEDWFTSMNIDAAKDNAVAIHYRQANEIWFAIPVDGSSINNRVVVYDYLSNAWTRYDGISASALFIARGTQPAKVPFYGGYTGSLYYFGSSLLGDNGAAITCMVKSVFAAPTGQTVERQYRRFYLNLDPVLGVTQAITANFYSNYGSSIVATRTMYQAPFQSRVDFGISAKSIQAQVIHASASLSLKINGFAFESRYQRAT